MNRNARLGSVQLEVARELLRQYDKWGEQNHDTMYWLGILMEEVGEASKAAIEYDYIAYRTEMVHVAAVAVNMIEAFDRSNIHSASSDR